MCAPLILDGKEILFVHSFKYLGLSVVLYFVVLIVCTIVCRPMLCFCVVAALDANKDYIFDV